jgi:PAS domain-containing protein
MADVRAHLAHPGRGEDGMLLVRLDAAHQPLGALVLAPPPALSADQRVFLSTVADVIAPVLRKAAYAHRLESEVIERTRQIDRERRITERIIDSLPVGLYVVDRDYRISVWNRKRETGMQGVSRDDALGSHDLRGAPPPAGVCAAPRVRRRVRHRAPADLPDGVARVGRAAHVSHLEDSDAPRRRSR